MPVSKASVFGLFFFLISFNTAIAQESKSSLLSTYHQLTEEQLQDSSSIALYLKLSKSFYNLNQDSSLLFSFKGLKLAETYQIPAYIADANRDIGVIEYMRGNYIESLNYFLKADSVFRAIQNKRGIMKTVNVMGLIHAVWEDHESALNYYKSGLRIAAELNDEYYINIILNYNIGITYMTDKKLDSAMITFTKVRDYAVKIDDSVHTAKALMFMSEVSRLANNNLEGLAYANQSRKLFKDNYLWDLGFLYGAFAGLYNNLGFSQKALEYGHMALEIEDQLQAKWELLRIHKILAETYDKAKMYPKSVYHFKLYDAYRDTLFDYQKQQTIARLGGVQKALENERLTHEKIENEQTLSNQKAWILFLAISLSGFLISTLIIWRSSRENKRLNAELIKKNTELDDLNSLKSEMLAIIGHDMINMTTSLGGFINLFNLKEITAEEFAQISPALEENIERVRLSFNNLFRWAESQKDGFSEQRIQFNPNKQFTEVVDLFSAITLRKNIALGIDASQDIEITFDVNHLTLIIRNLVHNAIKFTPEGGMITIYARYDNFNIRIGVKDTGLGISNELVQNILNPIGNRISKPGTRNEKGTGLGLIATKRFLKLNGSQLNVESEEGKGADFYFYVDSNLLKT
ncbi:sensor histidine kinase [bacterium]|nr:MAG: sensor histidine kinase [bacterium]